MVGSFLLVFVLYCCLGRGLCDDCSPMLEKKSAEAVLREKLFCKYNKNVRPVKYQSNQTVLQMEMFPLRIDVDDIQEKIYINGKIQYVWDDDHLRWDPRAYENIQFLSVDNEEIWRPYITVSPPSDASKLDINGGDCFIHSNGQVLCFPDNMISAHCSQDLTRYPFDRQNCTFIFFTPTRMGLALDLKVIDTGITMSRYRPNKAWEIVSISLKRRTHLTGPDESSPFYPCLVFNVLLQRRSAAHVAIIILPGLVIACLTLMTFFMDDLYSSRIALAGLASLCNVLYCLYLGQNLRPNGDRVPLVVTFFRDSLLISFFAVGTSVLVHRLQRISQPPRNWISALVSKMEISPFNKVLFVGESHPVDEDTAGIIEDAKTKKQTAWSQLATIIDRIVFFLSFLVYVVLFFFYLP